MSAEYTPTTEGVRDDYANWRVWVSSNLPKTVATGRSEFDRWLAAHDAEVEAQAREQVALKLDGARMIHAAHAVRGES